MRGNGCVYMNDFTSNNDENFSIPVISKLIKRLGQAYHVLKSTRKDEVLESALLYMVILRLLSGSIELTVAGLMLISNDLEKALNLNSMLALVGPSILIITTGIGLSGLSEKISFLKMVCLLGGITLILISMKLK